MLSALALFHVMETSPRLLHVTFGASFALLPSLCTLYEQCATSQAVGPQPEKYKVRAGGSDGEGATCGPCTHSRRLKACPHRVRLGPQARAPDGAALLLHVISGLQPWALHSSVIHKDAWQKLVLARVCGSKALACLVAHVEGEAARTQASWHWGLHLARSSVRGIAAAGAAVVAAHIFLTWFTLPHAQAAVLEAATTAKSMLQDAARHIE